MIIYLSIILIIFVIFYLYTHGSYKIDDKNYACSDKFCLAKELTIDVPVVIKDQIYAIMNKPELFKRVDFSFFPIDKIGNLALPSRSGLTLSTQKCNEYIPELIKFYKNELCQIVSQSIGIDLHPTSLDLPTSCAIITYNKKNDWINWHYDHNYYKGRFFTVLIPITHEKTCTKFQILDENNKIISFELNKKSICFEGNYVFHRASKLCKNENRTILSCQFVTQNSMSLMNKLKIKFKDFAFTGSLLKG